uniref:Uncharacterized protein n=1 Tax=Picea glauca TaxID=3330 RepID=A0A101LZR8_PICGL|nr:hypothetical protein ABT39_MTgene5356 [Picea glauca]QHR88949.1 hypothetical protein Q903MT_gene2968 [Picea sitchensis]
MPMKPCYLKQRINVYNKFIRKIPNSRASKLLIRWVCPPTTLQFFLRFFLRCSPALAQLGLRLPFFQMLDVETRCLISRANASKQILDRERGWVVSRSSMYGLSRLCSL